MFGKEKRKNKRIHTGRGGDADPGHGTESELFSRTGASKQPAGMKNRAGVCNYRHAVFFLWVPKCQCLLWGNV